MFIDETGTATNMARRHGRCRRGSRLIGRVPHGHWKTTTFVAGLRVDAVTAPFVIDRAMNGEIFRTYIERCLVPTLTPGDIVIMDNLPAHKVAGVREAIAAIGAVLLYLPPYSPDFNPIEMLFAKLKALLRKAAERTIASLWDAIGRLLDDFSADECSRYLTHADTARSKWKMLLDTRPQAALPSRSGDGCRNASAFQAAINPAHGVNLLTLFAVWTAGSLAMIPPRLSSSS